MQTITTLAELLQASAQHSKIVIDAYTDWCGPCKVMSPIFEGMAKRFPTIVFYKVNCDEAESALVLKLEIANLPTFVLVSDGAVVNKVIGANREALQNMLKQHS